MLHILPNVRSRVALIHKEHTEIEIEVDVKTFTPRSLYVIYWNTENRNKMKNAFNICIYPALAR